MKELNKDTAERFDKESWEIKTDMFIELWKKYYSEKMTVCPDCNGFTLQVCEKALKEMVGAFVKRVEKENISEIELAEKRVVRDILALRCSYDIDHEKMVHHITIKDYASSHGISLDNK